MNFAYLNTKHRQVCNRFRVVEVRRIAQFVIQWPVLIYKHQAQAYTYFEAFFYDSCTWNESQIYGLCNKSGLRALYIYLQEG